MTTATITSQDTPMLRQYKSIKAKYTDSILFFRLGDFYEMFLEDAITASKALSLTLTGRGKDENRIPMCGIPYHAADNYIQRLVEQGYKVAICEQVEEATAGKGITKREVVKIWTPGTIDRSEKTDENTYLLSFYCFNSEEVGYSYLDIHTGECRLGIANDMAQIQSVIQRTQAKEIIVPLKDNWKTPTWWSDIDSNNKPLTTQIPMISADRAKSELKRKLGIQSLKGFGITNSHNTALPACWALIDYALMTQKHNLAQLTKISPVKFESHLFLDRATIKNLELVQDLQDGLKQNSLFDTLNFCKTAMGSRLLKSKIQTPYSTKDPIIESQNAVEALKNDLLSREEIRDCLNQVYDIERLSSRIASGEPSPKDLIALKTSLSVLIPLDGILEHLNTQIPNNIIKKIKELKNTDSTFNKILLLLNERLLENPSTHIRDGNVINPKAHPELEQLLNSFKTIKTWIKELEPTEREKTGIKKLKVGFNKVFGYYFEIPNSQIDNVPNHYIRKQTLTNAERYITSELKEKETILLSGEDKQKNLESKLYMKLIDDIIPTIPYLQELGELLGTLDTLQSLATAAQKFNYTRPKISDDPKTLIIKKGRHPILENHPEIRFIPNDITIKKDTNNFILLTGPNMAGKSTIMRQIALIVIMAQIGSFVPADYLEWYLVDKLYTRIGALDNLYAGQSTFMVEMLETASILNTATKDSLILLDEIGRGTSTYDGMSIACAVSEHIHQHINARTLFATHYHELTALESQYKGISNYNMGIEEINGKLIFTHKLTKGYASKSYGIHVARMAGIPQSVIKRAESHLNGFDTHGINYIQNTTKNQIALFE